MDKQYGGQTPYGPTQLGRVVRPSILLNLGVLNRKKQQSGGPREGNARRGPRQTEEKDTNRVH